MIWKKIAAFAALTTLLSGIMAFSPSVLVPLGFSSGLRVQDTVNGPVTLYNAKGKKSIIRIEDEVALNSAMPKQRGGYARAIFREIKNDEVYNSIIKIGSFSRVRGVFVRENKRVLELWTVNLLGQDLSTVKARLATSFPGLFFNLVPYDVEDKTSSKIYGLSEFSDGEKNSITGKVFATVYFFPDVPQSRRDSILRAYIDANDFLDLSYEPRIRGLREKIKDLALFDEVEMVSVADTLPKITNNVARALTRVNNIQVIDTTIANPTTTWLNNTPYSNYYFGRNVSVGVYDMGIDTGTNDKTSSDDFKHRTSGTTNQTRRANTGIPWSESSDPNGSGNDWVTVHGNHVAGIIGGNGWNSSGSGGSRYLWRGIAPKCLFISRGTTGDGIGGFDGHVNNHSHILTSPNGPFAEGYYNSADNSVDATVNNHATTHTMVYAAANNGIAGYGAQRGYYSILSNTKNAITVGMVAKDTAIRNRNSSMGPTRDGRIKPDLVAPGSSYEYPERNLWPMRVEFDSITFKRSTGTIAKTFDFNTLNNSEGWVGTDNVYTTNHQVNGGVWSFNDVWVGAWVKDTAFSPGYTSNPNDTLIIRYRVKHPQIPVKCSRLRVGISWNFPAGSLSPPPGSPILDSLRFSLPTPDTVNFQTAKFRLRDLRGWSNPNDATNGIARWPTGSNVAITKLWLHFESDTLSFIQSANSVAANAPKYMQQEGTSMAAPHVTGITALLLEKWRTVVKPGANLDTQGPWNSTMKAVLVHTATDLVNAQPSQWENPNMPDSWASVSPDLCGPLGGCTREPVSRSFVKYYAGPDFATGYGLVNAEQALNYTDSNRIVQDSIRRSEGAHTFKFTMPAGVTKYRVTLAWDDAPGDVSLPIDQRKLVNDLDLSVVDLNGNVYYPWALDPLPQNIVGNQPPANGLDPIDSANIQPAYQGINDRDNLEVVDVAPGGTLPVGTWKVIVKATQVLAGTKQDFSVVADYKLTRLSKSVGWLNKGGPCYEGVGYVYISDENPNNGTQSYYRLTGTSGSWTTGDLGGLYQAGPATELDFCRESIDTLPQTRNPYAVLKLSNSCPVNGLSFARIENNENTGNGNQNSGAIAPSTQTIGPPPKTTLWFCYVKGNGGTSDPPWKARTMGAFANVNQTVNGNCNEMHWHISDDEDTGNQNAYDWSQLSTKSDSTQIKANIFNNATTETHWFWNACQ